MRRAASSSTSSSVASVVSCYCGRPSSFVVNKRRPLLPPSSVLRRRPTFLAAATAGKGGRSASAPPSRGGFEACPSSRRNAHIIHRSIRTVTAAGRIAAAATATPAPRRSISTAAAAAASSPCLLFQPRWFAADTGWQWAPVHRSVTSSAASAAEASRGNTADVVATPRRDDKDGIDEGDGGIVGGSKSGSAAAALVSEEWIPPPSPPSASGTDANANAAVHAGNVAYRQQERVDRAYREADDALFHLTEEEEATLGEEEILRRLEVALAEMDEEQEEEERRRDLEGIGGGDDDGPVDWMQTRRAALMGAADSPGGVVTVRHHQLMTVDEIRTLLEEYGGHDVVVLPDDLNRPRMGGAEGMVVCSSSDIHGPTAFHSMGGGGGSHLVTTLTRALIEHLKARRLDEVGVLGAQMRPPARASTSRDDWHVVDCGNFIVHILGPPTRRALQLERLWSGKDPLWRLDLADEDAVEDYCARHPVPAEYGQAMNVTQQPSAWDARAVRRLEKNQYTTPPPSHRPVVPNATKSRDRRAGRRRRRDQQQSFKH